MDWGPSIRPILTFLTFPKASCPNSHNVRYRGTKASEYESGGGKKMHLVTIVESEEPGYACPCRGSINGLGNSVTSYALTYIVTILPVFGKLFSTELN